jgi:DNA damage-binding protein 1
VPLESSTIEFATDVPTIALANVLRRVEVNGKGQYDDSSFVVQVTSSEIRLLEHNEGGAVPFTLVRSWAPAAAGEGDREIVAASINPSQIVLGLKGGKLCVLALDPKNKFITRK